MENSSVQRELDAAANDPEDAAYSTVLVEVAMHSLLLRLQAPVRIHRYAYGSFHRLEVVPHYLARVLVFEALDPAC